MKDAYESAPSAVFSSPAMRFRTFASAMQCVFINENHTERIEKPAVYNEELQGEVVRWKMQVQFLFEDIEDGDWAVFALRIRDLAIRCYSAPAQRAREACLDPANCAYCWKRAPLLSTDAGTIASLKNKTVWFWAEAAFIIAPVS